MKMNKCKTKSKSLCKHAKQALAVVLTLALMLSLVVLPATAAESKALSSGEALAFGDYFYSVLDDGTVEITGYTGSDTEIVIPSEIEGKSVTSIGGSAFGYNTDPDTYEKIKIDNFTITGYKSTAAEKYAIDNGFEFVSLNYTLQDNNTDISVDIKNNAELVVETLTDSESIDKANVALVDKAEVLALYDISLLKDGVAVQLDDTAKVKIPTDNENAKVYRIEEDGTATDMNAVYENGYLVFVTDHFSVYAVAEPLKAALGDVNGDGNISIADAIMIQKHIANIVTLDGDSLKAADVTKDGVITIADAITIQKHIANIIKLV